MITITKTINGKQYTYERKERKALYTLKRTFKFNEQVYNEFTDICKEKNEDVSKVIRSLIDGYIEKNKKADVNNV